MTVPEGLYVDTSALAKLYVPERGSDDLEHLLVGRTDLIVSDLAVTELSAALARRVREKRLTGQDARTIYRQLLRDITAGHYYHLPVTAEAHREAERLLSTIGHLHPLRSADALHLAMAVIAKAQALATFDQHMRDAALALGTLELLAT